MAVERFNLMAMSNQMLRTHLQMVASTLSQVLLILALMLFMSHVQLVARIFHLSIKLFATFSSDSYHVAQSLHLNTQVSLVMLLLILLIRCTWALRSAAWARPNTPASQLRTRPLECRRHQ